MPVNILMPALSPTMEKGNLAKWTKKEGDKVKPGDVIAEIETDKATMEVEAVDEGILAKILIPEGSQDVAVNEIIAVLTQEGEEAGGARPVAKPQQPTPEAAAMRADQSAPPAAPPSSRRRPQPRRRRRSQRIRTSPPGTEMVTMTVREALRDAMAEEMRKDDAVFVMGEEVAEYQGAYKITQGLPAGVRRPPRSSTRPSPSMALPASASARPSRA